MPARPLLRDVPRRAARPWPGEVPFTRIYSRLDRAVPWRSSHDPHARNIEVAAGHLGLLTEPAAFHEVTTARKPSDSSTALPRGPPLKIIQTVSSHALNQRVRSVQLARAGERPPSVGV